MKKWAWLVLVGVVVMVLAACSGGNNGKDNGVKGTEPAKQQDTSKVDNKASNETKEEERIKLVFWNLDETPNDSLGLQYLKDKFNIDIDFIPASREAMKETLNLQITSGNIPDWWKEPSFPEYAKFLEQDVAAEIPQEWIETYMPNYLEWLKRFLGDDPFKYVRRDGKIYGLPVIWDLGADGMQLGFREDWLRNVGLTKTPETLEEMEEALTRFRYDDPDGNGQKDTYGITSSGDSIKSMFSSVFGAFGVYPGIFQEEDGRIVYGDIEPGAKQALEVLQRWHANELIDPEFVVNKGENVENKVLTDRIGAIEYYWWAYLPGNAFLGGESWHDKLAAVHPDFSFGVVGGVRGPEGEYGIGQYNPAYASGVMFGKQLEQEPDKMIAYMQVFEASQFDPETYERLNFGIEGTHWEYSDKGTISFIGDYQDESLRRKEGLVTYSMAGSFNDYDFQTAYTSHEELRQLARDTRAKGTINIDILAPFDKPYYNEVTDRLQQFSLQNYIDFITGKRSLNEFDDYVAEWKKIGGEKVLEEAQQVYDTHLKGR